MSFRLPKWLKTISLIGLAFLLIYFAFKKVNVFEVWGYAKEASWIYVIISFAIGYSAVISRGFRWTIVLESIGKPVSPWNATHATAFGYLMNQVLPRAGEVARATALNRSNKIPINILIGTIIIERTIDLIMMALLVGVTFILSSGDIESFLSITNSDTEEPTKASKESIKYFILFVILSFFVVLIFSKKLKSTIWIKKIKTFMIGILDGFQSVWKLERKIKFWQHTFYIWTCYFFMIYICFFAFPFTKDLSIAEGLFIMAAAAIGYLVPVPGGIGAYHYLVTMALVVLGRTYEQGLAFATVVHTTQTLMMVSTGVVGFLTLTSKKE
jgi:uncharacterized protein (TIRG00374 family)